MKIILVAMAVLLIVSCSPAKGEDGKKQIEVLAAKVIVKGNERLQQSTLVITRVKVAGRIYVIFKGTKCMSVVLEKVRLFDK